MRTLLLASACIVVISGPALACRGTVEYPKALEQVEQSTVSANRLEELREQLSQGQAMHEDGHRQGDMGKMGRSLRILDEIMMQIGK
jgi:hypothetical protein